MPRRTSPGFAAPPMATPTMSPPVASVTRSPSFWMDLASATMPLGEKIILRPSRSVPVSTRPTMTVPASAVSKTLSTGKRNGFSAGRLIGPMASSASMAEGPEYHDNAGSEDFPARLSPRSPEIGTKGTSFCLYPTSFKKVFTAFLISSNLAEENCTETSSILVTQTAMFLMPMVKQQSASSRVRPLSAPASHSPAAADTARMATSAKEVTLSMLLTKS
mmetsp:Transcript_130569/g.279156  ORF Transcript_130569/g.279156 Transcript_130569/m.279156 type:complete len:219 (+) Transcript_130569:463-1119(+)